MHITRGNDGCQQHVHHHAGSDSLPDVPSAQTNSIGYVIDNFPGMDIILHNTGTQTSPQARKPSAAQHTVCVQL